MCLRTEDIEKLKTLSPEKRQEILDALAKILAVRPHRFSEDLKTPKSK